MEGSPHYGRASSSTYRQPILKRCLLLQLNNDESSDAASWSRHIARHGPNLSAVLVVFLKISRTGISPPTTLFICRHTTKRCRRNADILPKLGQLISADDQSNNQNQWRYSVFSLASDVFYSGSRKRCRNAEMDDRCFRFRNVDHVDASIRRRDQCSFTR